MFNYYACISVKKLYNLCELIVIQIYYFYYEAILDQSLIFQFFCLYATLEKPIKKAEIRQVMKTENQDRKCWATVDHQVFDGSGEIQLQETETILSILMKKF